MRKLAVEVQQRRLTIGVDASQVGLNEGVRPLAVMHSTRAIDRSGSFARRRTVSLEPAETAGFTTRSMVSRSWVLGWPGSMRIDGTIGTPWLARSSR